MVQTRMQAIYRRTLRRVGLEGNESQHSEDTQEPHVGQHAGECGTLAMAFTGDSCVHFTRYGVDRRGTHLRADLSGVSCDSDSMAWTA